MSEQRLHNLYLPPFKAAIDAGSDTVMCSFNAISGVPGCANHELETDLLKGEWGFDGFIESDYTAVAELRACPPKMPDEGSCGHGVAADGPDAGALALNAGTDSEMVSTNIRDYGKQLLAQRRISMRRVDDAVRRILRIKFRAGLFEHPYVDPAKAEAAQLLPDAVKAARDAAGRSMVLLKNDGGALPLKRTSTRRSSGRWPTAATTCSAPGGAAASTPTRSPCRRASRSRARARRRSPRAARSTTRSRRTTRPRATAAPRPGSTRPSRSRTTRTRSCSPSASRASTAARPRRAARSTCRVSRRS